MDELRNCIWPNPTSTIYLMHPRWFFKIEVMLALQILTIFCTCDWHVVERSNWACSLLALPQHGVLFVTVGGAPLNWYWLNASRRSCALPNCFFPSEPFRIVGSVIERFILHWSFMICFSAHPPASSPTHLFPSQRHWVVDCAAVVGTSCGGECAAPGLSELNAMCIMFCVSFLECVSFLHYFLGIDLIL